MRITPRMGDKLHQYRIYLNENRNNSPARGQT